MTVLKARVERVTRSAYPGRPVDQLPYEVRYGTQPHFSGEKTKRGTVGTFPYEEACAVRDEFNREQRMLADPVLNYVKRTRPDRKGDKRKADFGRPAAVVVDRQGAAMEESELPEGWIGEFKHEDVPNIEYLTAIAIQLARRHAGLSEWPISIGIDSPFYIDLATAHGIAVEVRA
jgi:hypothetical protein